MFTPFYNKAVRYLTVAFGSLFNNIYVQRLNSSGVEVERIRVPLGYGPKQKWIRRLREQNDSNETQISLPRMSFEMSDASYSSERKKNTLVKKIIAGSDNQKRSYNYTEVPYDFTFNLSILVKFMEDGLQIVEQILPYFTPEFTVTLNVNDVNQAVDVPIVLNDMSVVEEYEGDFDTRRLISFDMSFTAKSYVFGPTKTSGIIHTVTSNFYDLNKDMLFEGGRTGYGVTGTTGAAAKVVVGVTGPSGASSGIDTFTDYTVEIYEYGAYTGGIDFGGNIL
tara:strand:- start:601 stop:1437 length:837 start_codon:yes stop_codon:yes gene_type:complete